MTFRPALFVLPVALVACAESTTAPAAVTASAEDLQNGTVCPQDLRLDLSDYVDTDLPAMDEEFLVLNADRDGVTTTESGLQYKIVQPALSDGVVPAIDQQVEVLYHGYYPDGEVFDSAYERGVPISFAPNQVIAGWTEALSDMGVCEARILYIPGELAYGTGTPKTGARPQGTLLFNVQNLGVQ